MTNEFNDGTEKRYLIVMADSAHYRSRCAARMADIGPWPIDWGGTTASRMYLVRSDTL